MNEHAAMPGIMPGTFAKQHAPMPRPLRGAGIQGHVLAPLAATQDAGQVRDGSGRAGEEGPQTAPLFGPEIRVQMEERCKRTCENAGDPPRGSRNLSADRDRKSTRLNSSHI